MIAGAISGRTMWRSVWRLLAPRSAAAHSRRRSKPCRRAATISTTKGVVKTRWPAITVCSPSLMPSSVMKTSRPRPIRTPGIMIGREKRIRAAPGKRMAPGTSGLTGIVSRALARLATGHHVLDPERPPEHDEQDRHEDGDDDGQGRTLRELALPGEVHDQVRDQAPRRAADERRCQELAQDRDE